MMPELFKSLFFDAGDIAAGDIQLTGQFTLCGFRVTEKPITPDNDKVFPGSENL